MEKTIENRLRIEIIKRGGVALKLTTPGMDGAPDRLVLMPGGLMWFVEMKDQGRKPRPLQLVYHKMLKVLGFNVLVIDDIEKLKKFLEIVDRKISFVVKKD